jgi:hypothetical protein
MRRKESLLALAKMTRADSIWQDSVYHLLFSQPRSRVMSCNQPLSTWPLTIKALSVVSSKVLHTGPYAPSLRCHWQPTPPAAGGACGGHKGKGFYHSNAGIRVTSRTIQCGNIHKVVMLPVSTRRFSSMLCHWLLSLPGRDEAPDSFYQTL